MRLVSSPDLRLLYLYVRTGARQGVIYRASVEPTCHLHPNDAPGFYCLPYIVAR